MLLLDWIFYIHTTLYIEVSGITHSYIQRANGNKDIKSHNIFLQHSLGKTTYVLGDLDSAKIISRTGRPRTIIGTTCFMAPEVFTANGTTEYSLLIDGN